MNKPKLKVSKTLVGSLVSYIKHHKLITTLVLVLVLVMGWWWLIYSPYPKYPIKVPFAVEKAGTVYETNFTAPYWFNLGSRLTEISIGFVDMVPGRLDADLEAYSRAIIDDGIHDKFTTIQRLLGVKFSKSSGIEKPVMTYSGAEFVVRLTLTPHNNVGNSIIYDTGHYNGRRKRTLETPETPLVLIANMVEYGPEASLFRDGQVKILAYADLEMGGSYHLRVESLNDVPLPEGFETYLWVEQGYSPK